MPSSYAIDRARRVVFSRAWGPVSPPHLTNHAIGLTADPRFEPTFDQLLDFRAAQGLITDGIQMRALAAINPFALTARRAIVVSNALVFGVARMYQSLIDSDPEHFRLFSSLEEAMAWLGLEPGLPWPEPDAVFTAPGDPPSA